MSVFKCKMCGGNIEFNPGDSIGVCDSCGTKQTLPKLDDDRRANLYDRANHFRRNNEFDKAMSIYEKILEEDNTDAETYWSIVLCRYGIEYVEDPATHKRVPTVNRAQYSSVVSDKDYKSALKYGTPEQKELYKAEARAIDKIQKGILEISQKEEPFDVFICYKETDNQGRRTPDSVLANDLYHQLVQEGFKVFFSRITLEDKLGTAYEPYIFAALNSAKVMVVLGTRPEYFNAVWVKNEWNRYLALVNASGGKKMLIPAYKDMDPYDLPEEFSHLQAQDMSKLGFMQDLIRGIKKIVSADTPSTVVKETLSAAPVAAVNAAPLLERAFMFLEDGNWDDADAYCEKVLDQDPKNAQAYLGKLMAELQVNKQEDLKNCGKAFDTSSNYQKAVRFGDDDFSEQLKADNEENQKYIIYQDALKTMKTASDESSLRQAALNLKPIAGYKDSDKLREQCIEKAEAFRKDEIYKSAKNKMTNHKTEEYEKAIKLFESISGWKDSDEQVIICQQRIEEIKAKEEADRLEAERKAEEQRIAKEKAKQKTKKILKIAIPAVAVMIVFIIILNTVIIPRNNKNKIYNNAIKMMEEQKYDEAINAFVSLDDFKDSEEKIEQCNNIINGKPYKLALSLMKKGQYTDAIKLFDSLDAYKDSKEQIEKCKSALYLKAVNYYNNKNYSSSLDLFLDIKTYKDSTDFILSITGSKTVLGDGRCTVGLKADGKVIRTGWDVWRNSDVSEWGDIVAVSATEFHTVGLKSDGSVVALGCNNDGQCNVEEWADIIEISAGSSHTVGLKYDGTVVAVGDNYYGQCDVDKWKNIIAVSAGISHTVGLKYDGTVVATKYTGDQKFYDGECNVDKWTDIIAISAGSNLTVGLKSDGTVFATGSNEYGQCDINDWKDIVAVSAGENHTVGLKSDGTVVATGSNEYGQCDINDWKDIVAVSAGEYHTVGLKSDGTVVATGSNKYGQCDVGSWKDIKVPKKYK